MAERQLPPEELVNRAIRGLKREAAEEARKADASEDSTDRLDHEALSAVYTQVAIDIETAVFNLQGRLEEAAHAHSHAYELLPDQPATTKDGSAEEVAGGE